MDSIRDKIPMGYVVHATAGLHVLTVSGASARLKSYRAFTSTWPLMHPLMQLEPIFLSMVVIRRLRM